MKANPGGEIAPEEVIGRDHLIEQLWGTLANQSVILVAERRIGKSSVLKKMQAEPPDGVLIIYRDLEEIETPVEFVERFCQDIHEYLALKNRILSSTRAFMREIAGAEIGGVIKIPPGLTSHWKTLLEKAVEDLLSAQDSQVILFWDELPWMLQKIGRTGGELAVMAMLDTLRSLRQGHSGLRMVYTGSIGLHHVTTQLKAAGHTNDATNDMRPYEVEPLSEGDATNLARALIRGEGLTCEDLDATARVIARGVDGHPFYLHCVVKAMTDRGNVATAALAEQMIEDALIDPNDTWHMRHYRERLRAYYGEDREPVVLAILDELAVAKEPLGVEAIQRHLASACAKETSSAMGRIVGGDLELLREILTALQQDHYLRREPAEGAYLFRFPLIQRWWRIDRNLTQ